MSRAQYCGHLHDVKTFCYQSSTAQFFCEAVVDIIRDIQNGVRFSNSWWFHKEKDFNTLRVFGFICYVSHESKQTNFRSSHIPLQTLEFASLQEWLVDIQNITKFSRNYSTRELPLEAVL